MLARLRAARSSGDAPESGFTFVELVVCAAILGILAMGALPLARVSMKRTKEQELHRALREMRTAIDKFKDSADNGVISPLDLPVGGDNLRRTCSSWSTASRCRTMRQARSCAFCGVFRSTP